MPKANRPTKGVLERHPRAVILLAYRTHPALSTTPDDYDSEWFETPANQTEFFRQCCDWAEEDVANDALPDDQRYGHVLVRVEDTKTMRVSDVAAFHPHADSPDEALANTAKAWIADRVAEIKADPQKAVAPGAFKPTLPEPLPDPQVAAAQKGRKASEAAIVKQEDVAAKAPRRKKVDPAALKVKPRRGQAGATDVRKRIDTKKAEAGLPADVAAARDAEKAPTMGFAVVRPRIRLR